MFAPFHIKCYNVPLMYPTLVAIQYYMNVPLSIIFCRAEGEQDWKIKIGTARPYKINTIN